MFLSLETRLGAPAKHKARLYRTTAVPSVICTAQPSCSPICRVPYPLLFLISTSLKVELGMKNRTETLEIGSRSPEFSLAAANRKGTFTLGGLLAQGTLILEFLRGTW